MTETPYITSAEVAPILGWSQSTVNRKAALGEIPTVGRVEGPTGPRLFSREAIEALAAELAEAS